MDLALNLPLNSVSFGQISTLLLKTIYEREKGNPSQHHNLYLFPIGGQIDLSSQKEDKDFNDWIGKLIAKSYTSYSRDIPLFKLWHLNGSIESFSKNQTLLTFYETDKPTPIELNIAKNNKIAFTSQYTCDIFKSFGIDSTYLPLAFDSFNFSQINKKFHADGRVVFNLTGKFEKRKGHVKVIQSWIKKYGNNNKYVLQCALYNPFLVQQTPQGIVDHNQRFIHEAVQGNKPFNVVFYPHMKENVTYNEFLNSANIIIGMGNESWGLPEFHSVAIGKHSVILNVNGYKSWATDKNSTLISPNGKESSVDNIFFKQGDFNQGDFFSWNEEEFIAGCETAIKKLEANPINTEGLKLQQDFSKEKFIDNVLNLMS